MTTSTTKNEPTTKSTEGQSGIGSSNDSGFMVSEDTPVDFDPESMLPPHKRVTASRGKFGVSGIIEPSKKAKAVLEQRRVELGKLENPIYEEIADKVKSITSPEELSQYNQYPIAVLRLSEEGEGDKLTVVGSLKNLSLLHGGEFLHVEVEVSSKFILSALPQFMRNKLTLTEITYYIGGKPTKQDYTKTKFRSIICKDFEGTVTQCKLVFVRG